MAPPSYAGIGSRRTPEPILLLMESIAARHAGEGWVLRTGGSPGADEAFLRGALRARGPVELYQPWPGFQRRQAAQAGEGLSILARPSDAAYELAARFHPHWERLGGRERSLLARDGHQVLGRELEAPVLFLVCWTADASLDGAGLLDDGTGQSLRIAHHHRIAVFNLAWPEHARRFA